MKGNQEVLGNTSLESPEPAGTSGELSDNHPNLSVDIFQVIWNVKMVWQREFVSEFSVDDSTSQVLVHQSRAQPAHEKHQNKLDPSE